MNLLIPLLMIYETYYLIYGLKFMLNNPISLFFT